MQSTDSIETYPYRTTKDLVGEKEDIKCNNIIKWYKKIIDFDNVTKENIKELDLNQPRIPDHSYRILIIRGFGSGKRISLFNYSVMQPDINKNELYTKIYIFNQKKRMYRLKEF